MPAGWSDPYDVAGGRVASRRFYDGAWREFRGQSVDELARRIKGWETYVGAQPKKPVQVKKLRMPTPPSVIRVNEQPVIWPAWVALVVALAEPILWRVF